LNKYQQDIVILTSKPNLNSLELLSFNIVKVIVQLSNHFDDITFNLYFNSPCKTECDIKDFVHTHKYHMYLEITQKDKSYQFGFDFVTGSEQISESKYNDSKILLDSYDYFILDDIENNDDVKKYLSDIVYKILTSVCSIKNDEYYLAEVLFAKLRQDSNISYKKLLKELKHFNKIITWKKNDSIDIEDLFDILQLVDIKSEKTIGLKKFKSLLGEICEKLCLTFDSEEKTINFEIFQLVLLKLSSDYSSDILDDYKNVYHRVMYMLMEALKQINKLTADNNYRKKSLPIYMNNFMSEHIDELENKILLNKIYSTKANREKELFDKISDDLTIYCEDNVHDEEKLHMIYFDFKKLCDKMLM
jgi:hypothetical protein